MSTRTLSRPLPQTEQATWLSRSGPDSSGWLPLPSVTVASRAASRRLLTQVIRPLEQGGRDLQAERLGGFQIDDQLELRRSLHGQVGGLRTFQDSVDEVGGPSMHPRVARPKGQQPARFDELGM